MESIFIRDLPKNFIEKGVITAQSPSNIALVKYWGKKERQLPQNPSLSFTLNNCYTKTTFIFRRKSDINHFSFEIFFDGFLKDSFRQKVQIFFERILLYVPFLKHYHFEIHTHNSFPHSSGIASSASGMAAIAMCLVRLEQLLFSEITTEAMYKKASFLARLGSGSACRSLQGDWVLWGEHKAIKESSDWYGIHLKHHIHTVFKTYQDSILLIDTQPKQVSSSAGHKAMQGHPFAKKRFEQASKNIENLIDILKRGAIQDFINLVESEALTLHAMMMSSQPYFILMKPPTLEIIQKVWAFRKQKKIPLCFTLDAGANVHLLYPKNFTKQVKDFINTDLKYFCKNQNIIYDQVGQGSKWL